MKKTIYDFAQNKINSGEYPKAEILLKELIEQNNKDFAALKGLAYVYLAQSKYADSIPIINLAISLEAESSELFYFLALANFNIGLIKEAKKIIKIAKSKFPVHAQVGSLDEAIGLYESVNNNSHYEAIRNKFDLNSLGYDSARAQANYDTPKLIFDEVTRLNSAGFNRVLDLGCGTGLLGELFRESSKFLCGVDLSTDMMELALERKIYNELTEMDIITYLSNCEPNSWDVVVASSVFIYFGDLDKLFLQIKRVLCEKGIACFDLNLNQSSEYYSVLSANGMQFSHSTKYVHECAKKAGLEIQKSIAADFEYLNIGNKHKGTVYSFLKKNLKP